MQPVRFLKGHGTENDFVLLPDPDAALTVTPALVRRLTDRRAGIGGDGVIRVVPTAAVEDVAWQAGEAPWFMDYRNADGGLAEMCGNGARVFARYLVDAGLAQLGQFSIATRGGVRAIEVTGHDVTVDMGPCTPMDPAEVAVEVGGRRYLGQALSMGNPHVAVPVSDLADAGDLVHAPVVDPSAPFPTGVNVEFVLGRGPGRIAMRVFERGVGETRSCGTGACAAAVAAAGWWGAETLDYQVEVPGGVLRVRSTPAGSILLSGPTAFVASGVVDPGLWAGQPAGSAAELAAAGVPG
ncbi:MAG: diaminopimelate epimerase [Frankiales bacterium]|jgi:diaminopimelate epimerase|nr:diaminopimelate epimerase [Frankiales bacterium]